MQDERLRELYFGEDEEIHYDSTSQEKMDLINSFEYHAPKGESWA